jgi:hypothetical protein
MNRDLVARDHVRCALCAVHDGLGKMQVLNLSSKPNLNMEYLLLMIPQ